MQSRPVYQSRMRPDIMGKAYHPYREGGENSSYTYSDQMAEEKTWKNTKALEPNVSAYGNWTVENGKSRLHQFLQQHNIKADYRYSMMGPEESLTFVAEMTIYVKKLNLTLTGQGSASNKASASKNCALSLVRQLYHLGIVEAFSGTLKKNRDKENEIKPYVVAISPELERQVHEVLRALNVVPTPIPQEPTERDQCVSIINSTVLDEFVSSTPQAPSVVSWAPPIQNWNAWTGCSIEEGPWARNLNEISHNLEKTLRRQLQEDHRLQDMLRQREELPVLAVKKEIMQAINNNSVVIIRGSTGCGKTTQVCQFILDNYVLAGQGAYCNVVITQPRRISAISLSDRVAFERLENLGQSVGYSVRFESCLPRPFGSILFCTVGVLLKKLENGLKGISHVIVDEIHERDVNTDFVLVILRDMVRVNPHLRLILMSATVDTSLFSRYFGNCPVVEIPGRSYLVDEYFLEDCVEMLKFVPPLPETKKRKNKNSGKEREEEEEDDGFYCGHGGDESEENLNRVISPEYREETKAAMSRLNEKEISFELIEELLKHITSVRAPGAILIFLPGWNLIFALLRHLQQNSIFGGPDFVILPLHSQLPREDQRRVFETYPEHVRKVILATNIAETSITINDVVYVIDSCKAKMKIFTAHDNTTHYTTVWASKTNLEQRKGRAGRVRPGVCFRLCSRARFQRLEEHVTPEMFRTPLHELVLAIKMLRLGSAGQVLSKVVEPPPRDAVLDAEVLLREMKCLDSNDELTPLGRILGQLPIEPRLGKMMIMGCLFYCGDALATIAANSTTCLEVFIQTPERKRLTYQQKSLAGIRFSDHVTTLNAFRVWEEAMAKGGDKGEQFCEAKTLSTATLGMTREAKNQIVRLLTDIVGFPEETMVPRGYNYQGSDPELDLVVALLCMGLYPNVAYHQAKRRVLTKENKIALIHKSSVNCSNLEPTFPFPFFVYGEKIRTKVVSCKQLSMVSPIHLLLFGARKVEYVNKSIRLDGWIVLDMKPEVASAIVALRPALESLIVKASRAPGRLSELSSVDVLTLDVIKRLCQFNAGRHGMIPLCSKNLATRRTRSREGGPAPNSPEPKVPRFTPWNRRFGRGFGGGSFRRTSRGGFSQGTFSPSFRSAGRGRGGAEWRS